MRSVMSAEPGAFVVGQGGITGHGCSIASNRKGNQFRILLPHLE